MSWPISEPLRGITHTSLAYSCVRDKYKNGVSIPYMQLNKEEFIKKTRQMGWANTPPTPGLNGVKIATYLKDDRFVSNKWTIHSTDDWGEPVAHCYISQWSWVRKQKQKTKF